MSSRIDGGMVQSIGEIAMAEYSALPDFLQSFRYVIFEEVEDMLGLVRHEAVVLAD